jgi:hypothetical protein
MKEENPDRIDFLEPNKALIITQRRLERKYKENPELVKHYDKLINIVQNETEDKNELSFVKIGKNGN